MFTITKEKETYMLDNFGKQIDFNNNCISTSLADDVFYMLNIENRSMLYHYIELYLAGNYDERGLFNAMIKSIKSSKDDLEYLKYLAKKVIAYTLYCEYAGDINKLNRYEFSQIVNDYLNILNDTERNNFLFFVTRYMIEAIYD